MTPSFSAAFLAAILTAAFVPAAAAGASGGEDATNRAPRREVRAVWFTTASALDWPKGRSAAEHQSSLLAAVERLHRSGFNTIFFQVRGRGDAVYRSRFEPWSAVLTGKPGGDPGWDPLAFLVAEAHRRGMEVHAWFNTYFVKGGSGPAAKSSPPHVMTAHPSWVKFNRDRWWLDPGEPEVDDYLAGVAKDIATHYDIDGFQLDYLRYPGRDFDDRATWEKYGRGVPRDEWRRANVTRLLTRLRKLLLDEKPLLKLGVAPIGIYRNPRGVNGLESYADVYQDTYRWIDLGLLDYVVPQLYWPIGGGNGDPDFAAMAAEWRKRVSACQLYLGIGSYKSEVLAQGDRLVAAARAAGAEGEAFFRYASIEPLLPMDPYRVPALPPPMPWKDSLAPSPPALVTDSGAGPRMIAWTPGGGRGEPGGRYAVYRMSGDAGGNTPGERLIAVLPDSARFLRDSGAVQSGDWYAVTRLDRMWNESPPVRPARAGAGATAAGESPPRSGPKGILRLGTPWADVSSGMLFVPLLLGAGAGSGVTVGVEIRAPGEAVPRRLVSGAAGPGGRVIGIDIRGIGRGEYLCTVTAGGDVIKQPVNVGR